MKSYIRPTSMTWWSGVAAIVLGVLSMAIPESMAFSELGRVVAMLAGAGDSSPAGLILLGTGLIGIRAKLERAAQGAA
jgi:hypothetical protein